jgi:23S rRNA (uracil1939-C5)-methyltransferase
LKRGDELELHLESAAFEGKNIARENGLVAFVRGGVPGDDVRVRVTRTKKSFIEADLLEVVRPSAMRVVPRCLWRCGVQMAKWNTRRSDFKRQPMIVPLADRRVLGASVNPQLSAYFYRNKMDSPSARWLTREMKATAEAGEVPGEGPRPLDRFALGLHIPERFDRVLDIEECWLQSETSREIVNFVREFCKVRGLGIYSTVTHTGYLRNLVIRQAGTPAN